MSERPLPKARDTENRAFRKVLVATDFTPASKRAFRKGQGLAVDLEAELHLLHVGDSPRPRAIFFISIPHQSREAIGRKMQSRVRRRFEDFLRGEDLGGSEVVTVFREGAPHREIVAYAAEQGVDLIVVGERHETKAQHLLQHLAFESVGERVRREAPCAVLTVR